MTTVADRWIVTNHDFKKHESFAIAEGERDRLIQANPGMRFRVLRIKTSIQPAGGFQRLRALLQEAQSFTAIAGASADLHQRIRDALRETASHEEKSNA